MDYTLELANKIAEELRAMPPKDPSKRRLTKQGMVRHLAQEITALQKRGYTIEEVVESLSGRGLDITTPTLKSYLQRSKAENGKRSKATRDQTRTRDRTGPTTPGGGNPAGAPPQAIVVSEAPVGARTAAKKAPPPAASPAETAPLRSGKSAFLVKDKDSY